MQAAEHIVLESDAHDVPQFHAGRRVHAVLQCRSRLRRRSLRISVVDYYYLAVSVGRSGAAPREYVLDLRFVDPRFTLTRHTPWGCIWVALTMTLATAAASALWYATGTASRSHHLAATAAAALWGVTALAYLVVAARLVESVALRSLHGRATVFEYRGGIGTLRRMRPFMRELAAHVQLAAAARRSSKAEHLRDELREHHRLMEAGVLAGDTYDCSKAQILARHEVRRAASGAGSAL